MCKGDQDGRLELAEGSAGVDGDRDAGADPPLPGTLPAEIWEVRPRSGETDDHQLLVETYPAPEESVTGPSDGESLVPSLEPRPVAALTPRRAVSKTPAAVGAGVGALAAVVVLRRVLRRFA